MEIPGVTVIKTVPVNKFVLSDLITIILFISLFLALVSLVAYAIGYSYQSISLHSALLKELSLMLFCVATLVFVATGIYAVSDDKNTVVENTYVVNISEAVNMTELCEEYTVEDLGEDTWLLKPLDGGN